MKSRFARHVVAAVAIGCSAVLMAPAVAHAAPTQVAPTFFPGTVNSVRTSGSETTFYVMNQVMALYTQSAIYGCVLQADLKTCNTAADDPFLSLIHI